MALTWGLSSFRANLLLCYFVAVFVYHDLKETKKTTQGSEAAKARRQPPLWLVPRLLGDTFSWFSCIRICLATSQISAAPSSKPAGAKPFPSLLVQPPLAPFGNSPAHPQLRAMAEMPFDAAKKATENLTLAKLKKGRGRRALWPLRVRPAPGAVLSLSGRP